MNQRWKSPWEGKRYHTFNSFLRHKFGEKVYRVSLDAGFTCPNRDGTFGENGCVYCNEAGSRANYVNPEISIKEQLHNGAQFIRNKYKAQKFIAYFQAYTNTYASPETLKNIYLSALEHPDVVGISIGTRPDMIDSEKLEVIQSIAHNKWVLIEYGAQSMWEETLSMINRQHRVEDTVKAIKLTQQKDNIDILAHVIFGLPGETPDMMKQSVSKLIDLGINAFKFHHLYVEKGTALAEMYQRGEFKVISKLDYMNLLIDIIPQIPPEIVLHRLFGQSSPKTLVAPRWTLHKNELIHELDRQLEKRELFQGKWAQISPSL